MRRQWLALGPLVVGPLLLGVLAAPGSASVSLTLMTDHALTPNATDTIGVFARCFYHPARHRFYTIYAGRPAGSALPAGQMTHFAWREYDASFAFTGRQGSLPGLTSVGDYAIAQVNSDYLVLSVTGVDYRLSKFDDDFTLLGATTIPLDVHDSNTDQMMGFGNGRLLIGALNEPTETHPHFPMKPAWTPSAHLFQYDASLNPVEQDRFLSPTFYAWGGTATYNPATSRYVVVSMDSFPTYQLFAYEYDANWNQVGMHPLSADGQWSQGLLWDGAHWFVAWHSGHEHRCGNIVIAAFDIDWNLEASITITHNAPFPPPLGSNLNAQRPFLTKVGDSLYVSYDVDRYTYLGGNMMLEDRAWQSHVSVVRIGSAAASAPDRRSSRPTFDVFPVPSSGRVRYALAGIDGNPTIEVLDVAGRILERHPVSAGAGSIDLAGRGPGIYFVRLRRGSEVVTTRRIVSVD